MEFVILAIYFLLFLMKKTKNVMAFKKTLAWQGIFFLLLLLNTLTLDQHMLLFSEFFNGFSVAWYSTLRDKYYNYMK